MAFVSPIVNEPGSDFNDKLELSLAYAGRMIEEDARWLTLNRGAESKLKTVFSTCRCYEAIQLPVLHSTLDPNSAPFVAKSRVSRLDPAAPPFVVTPTEIQPTPLKVSTETSSAAYPLVLLGPPMGPPTLMVAAPVAPTWVPPPMLPRPPPSALPQGPMPYPGLYQPPYYQPLVSPPLCNLNPCPYLPRFGPTCQPPLAYPGSMLAPSPPLVMSPTTMLLSRTCSPESSVSLPATPVASPDPLVEFPTFVPRYQGPVYSNVPYNPPYVSYCDMPIDPLGLICSCPCYGPVAY